MLFEGRRGQGAGRGNYFVLLRPAPSALRPYKLRLSIVLTLYFCILYFSLQRIVFFVPRQLQFSRVDDLIRFDPRWTIVYQSLYLLLPVPWLATTLDQLRRYTRGFLVVTIVSFLFFFALPIEGPRPDQMTDNALYRLLITYDRNLNAFPSLHAALTVYTFLFALRILSSGGRAPRLSSTGFALIAVIGTLWVALILFATMATKQHFAIDVVAGAFIAICADLLAWRYTPRIDAVEEGP